MKEFIWSILLTLVLIASTWFAFHFVSEGWAVLFEVYCTLIVWNVILYFIEPQEEYRFKSVLNNV